MKYFFTIQCFQRKKISLLDITCGLLLSTISASQYVIAAPQGGEVVSGQGSINAPSSSVTQILQSSQNLVVDWQSFNVGANELVQFVQPSSTSTALNRINDISPSQIFGSIEANGLIFLVNPNGIIFGEGSHIQVNGLFATNLEIDPSRFMSGDYAFESMGMIDGMIVNHGVISAATGGVSLISDTGIVNDGKILATAGSVNLAVTTSATLDFTGDGLLKLSVTGEVINNAQSLNDAISNSGEIIAQGGDVLLSGQVARDVFTNVVNNTGVIKATRVLNEGGVITLAGSSGNISNSGTLDVSGAEAGDIVVTAENITHSSLIDASATEGNGGSVTLKSAADTILDGAAVISARAESGVGGTIQVLGDRVGLFGQTGIDASGLLGGGEVLLGGDFQGKNADVQNALQTAIGADVSIKADAIAEGNGGKVVVWADQRTQYYGDISVQGGELFGNGGFVEVSGKNILNFAGTVDTTAVNGNDGTLLLDPLDIIIADGAGAANDGELLDLAILFGDGAAPATDVFTISEQTLEGLAGNVVLQAQQDIILSDLTTDGVLDFSLVTGGSSVVFQAGRHITFNNVANTIQTNGGNIHLEADSQHSSAGAADGTGALTLGLLNSNGGDITLLAAGTGFGINGAISAGAGNVYISTSDNTAIDLDADITQAGFDFITTTGALTIGQATTAGTNGLGAGAVTEYAASTSMSASITIGSASASAFNLISTGGFAGAGGAVTLTANQALVINGDIDANNVGNVEILGQVVGTSDISITANEIYGDNDNSSPPDEIYTTGMLTLTGNVIGAKTGGGDRALNIGGVTTLIINDLGAGDIEINLTGTNSIDIGVSANALDLANWNNAKVKITDFTYNNTHSAVSLGTLSASGKNLTINAANGITDNTSAVTAQNLTLISGAGIGASGTPINTVADLLTITSNGGDVYISDSLVGGSNLGLLTTVAGSTEIVELTAANGWNITQSNVNGAGGAGVGDTITLIATTGDIDRTAGQLIANDLTLNAVAGGIGIGGAIDASANTIALTTGGTGATGNIFFATTGSFDVATFGGAVTTDAATGQIIDLTADDWSVSADTTVGDANDSLVLHATTGGITDGTVGLGGNKLTAAAIAFSVTGLNDIDVTIDAGSVAALADNGGSATGSIQIDNIAAAPGTLIVDSINGIAGITAVDNSITLNSTDAGIDIQQGISSGTGAISLTTTEATPGNYDISGVGVISTDGGTVTVDADGAININTVIDDSNGDGTGVSGTLNLTSGGSEAALANSGDITVVDTGVLSAMNLSTLSTFNDGQTIDLTSGSGWNIASGLGSANDVITLTATDGDITRTAGTIVASDLTLEALGSAGGIGASGAAILTNAGALTLSSGGNSGIEGDIYVTDSSATVLKSVTTDASAQTIVLAALSWDINDALAAGIGDTADTITITATGGDITYTAGTIAAAALTLDSFGAIGAIGTPLLTNAGLLTLASGGDIYISDSFTGTSTLGVLTTANGTTEIVELTGANGWDITQSNVNGAGGVGVGDTISLIATTGNIDRSGGTLTANDLTLNAVAGGMGIGGGAGLRAPVDAVANSISLITGGADSAGDIYFATTGAFSVSAFSGNVTTAAGGLGQTIELAADSWVIDGATIGDANDSLVLTALTGGFSGVGTLSAAAVALNAIGAQDINVTTDAATIAASSGGGVININSVYTGGNLVVGSVGTVTGISTTDNNISLISTDASIDIQQDINAGTGSVSLTTIETVPGNYDIGGVANVIASGGINIDSDNAINLNTTSAGGTVSLINHDIGSVTVTDSGAIQLGTVSVGAGTFTINAGGAITQTSPMTIAGASSFSAGANAITLDDLANDFVGAVSLGNSGANNVIITDANAIDLGTVTVGTGTFTVNAGTNITDSGTQTVGGNAVFNVGALGNITLNDAANAYNAGVTFASAGTLNNVTFVDTTAYDVQAGGLLLSGNLSITAAGITQTGDLTVTGASTFNAGANAITLTNATNDFIGAVSLNNSGANAVSVTDANSIILGTSSVGNGGFTINATGTITQSGALTIAGASSFNAGANAITLTSLANDFSGAVSLSNSGLFNVQITDANAIDLGVINTGTGTFIVNAGTNITDSGTQTVGGAASFNVGNNGNITLNDASNAYASTVSFNPTSGTLGNVTFVDTTALDLQGSTIGGNLDVTGAGITQSGALIVAGTSSFNAGTNTITLNNVGNNFVGAVSLSNSGTNAVSIRDANAIQLGTVSVGSGSFSVIANGAITQASALTIAGTSSFSAGANVITLTNAANDFIGAVSLFNSGANNVAITDANAIDLGTVTVGGNLNVNATGAITDSGVLTVAGTTTLAAGSANNIVLDTATNNFNNIVITSANNVTLVDAAGGAGIAASTISGDYSLTSVGDITSSGLLSAANANLLVTGSGKSIGSALTPIAIDLSGNLTATASNGSGGIHINDASNLAVTSINAGTGNVILRAVGSITDAAGADTTVDIIANNLTIDSTAGAGVDATDALNLQVANLTITNSTGDFFLTEANTLTLRDVTVGSIDLFAYGDLTVRGNVTTLTGDLKLGSAGVLKIFVAVTSTLGIETQVPVGSALEATLCATLGGSCILSFGDTVFTTPRTYDAVTLNSSAGGNIVLTSDDIQINVNTPNDYTYNTLRPVFEWLFYENVYSNATLNAGVNSVIFDTYTPTNTLTVGSSSSMLTAAEIGRISAAGAVQFGTAANTGGVQLTTSINTAAFADTLLVTSGDVTTSAAANTITADNLILNAGTGIGVTKDTGNGSAATAVRIASNSISATNTTSGDIFLSFLGNATLGGVGQVIDNQAADRAIGISATGNLIIANDFSVAGLGTIDLNAGGTITRTAGTITANTINLGTGSTASIGASGTPVITNANYLNAYATGDIFVENISATVAQLISSAANITFVQSGAGDLVLGGLVASGTIDITTTSSSINGMVLPGIPDPVPQYVKANDIVVVSNGSIGASVPLYVDAANSLSLTTNGVGAAGSIYVGSKTAMTLSGLTTNNGNTSTVIGLEAPSFTIDSPIGDGTGNLLLNASNGSITLNASLNYIDLYLGATNGGITQNAGVITATQLLIRSDNTVSLPGANDVVTLAANVANPGQDFTFNDVNDLNLAQITGSGTLITTAGITTNNGIVNLTTGGALTQAVDGVVNGNALITSSVGGTVLNTAVNNVSSFNGTDTTFDILLSDSGTLNVTGISTGGNVTLVSSSLTQSGIINANQLTTSTSAGSNLNLFNTVNGYSATNTTSGNIVLNDNVATLTLGGISQSGGGDIIISNTGAIAQSAAISGALLNVTASGGINLSNASNGFSSFSGKNLGGGDILVVDTTALDIVSVSTAGNVSLTAASLTDSGAISASQLTTTTANGSVLNNIGHTVNTYVATNTTSGDIVLNDNVAALTLGGISQSGGGAITITNSGTIAQAAAISGALLNVAASGGINLSNASNSFSSFSGTNLGGGDILVVDTTALDIVSASTAGNISLSAASLTDSGVISVSQLTTTTANGSVLDNTHTVNTYVATNTTSGDIVLNDNVAALTLGGISQSGGGAITITNTGTIAQSAAISGALLNVAASGGINLSNASNSFSSFSGTNLGGGDILLVDTTALDIVSASTAGNISLSADSLTDSGVISASQLTTNTANGSVLDNTHTVNTYVATNTTSGNIVLNDNVGLLTLGGISQSGGGDIIITNTGAIAQSAAISGALLNVTASGGINLSNASNSFSSFSGMNLGGGDILVVDAGALDIVGINTTGNVELTAGSLTDSGNLVAASLITTTTGGVTLDSAGNTIGAYSGSDTLGGSILLNNTGTLALGAVSTDTNISITSSGNIVQVGNVSSSTGDITVQSISGSLSMQSGSNTTTTDGIITYQALGDVVVTHIDAASGVSANVGFIDITSNTNILMENSASYTQYVRADAITLTAVNIGVDSLDPFNLSDQIQGTITLNYGGTAAYSAWTNVNVNLTVIDNGAGAINAGAARSAGTQRSQSSGLEDVGFIDLALFSDINLFVVDGIGIKLPADQSDEAPLSGNIPVNDEEIKKKKKPGGLHVSALLP